MEPVNDKEMKATQSGRRKFLMRAGLGSLPVLLTLKSKSAWGSSTLNCSLSENASQMQSVQPDKFEQCSRSYDSHGSAKLYFESKSSTVGGGKGGYFFKTGNNWQKKWNGIEINQSTKFNTIFQYGYSGTLRDALNQGGSYALERNIAAIFLHALYYQLEGISTSIPTPDEIVNAYQGAVTKAQKDQLLALLVYYIDGYMG
ncbi:hypothetical protein SAMN05660691_02841 [Rheinheimera pacifica]|uniref:Uncharacterized protein n=1 Tax=Rheinheimera pacifica TaxID=173990 RepID=A0A1H6MQQ9_9GAMM|nr:hypothetical protein [Rheinheimera pacifica]SEI01743.1 hypothetical protein SAMN05660691_02841 [Rheinheimera pacifica]